MSRAHAGSFAPDEVRAPLVAMADDRALFALTLSAFAPFRGAKPISLDN